MILATAEGFGTNEVEPVWRWQKRFMEEGVDGLLRDKTRKPGTAPLAADKVAEIVDLTFGSARRDDAVDAARDGEDRRRHDDDPKALVWTSTRAASSPLSNARSKR